MYIINRLQFFSEYTSDSKDRGGLTVPNLAQRTYVLGYSC